MVHCIFENQVTLKLVLEWVWCRGYEALKPGVLLFEESPFNRDADFRSCTCPLFPRAFFIDFIWCSLIGISDSMQFENMFRCLYGQQRASSDCAFAQSDQALCCPLTDSMDSIECINGEQRTGWSFAHAQDDLNLRIFCLTQPNIVLLTDMCKAFVKMHMSFVLYEASYDLNCCFTSRKHAYIILTPINPTCI